MVTFLKNIAELSDEYHFVEFNRIMFEFTQFLIIVECTYTGEEDIDDLLEEYVEYSSFHGMKIEEIPSQFAKGLAIDSIYISEYEYLGYREDVGDFNDASISISHRMFQVLQHLNVDYDEVITKFKLDLNYGYNDNYGMCPGEPNYIYKIHLDSQNEKIFDVIQFLKSANIEYTSPNDFYLNDIKKYVLLDAWKPLPMITTQTKVRRLGYLVILAEFLAVYKKIPANKISKKFEEYSLLFTNKLDEIENNKGIIKQTKNGISAKPYINLAKEAHWITKINKSYISGKRMVVYQILKSQLKSKESNVFKLSLLDKLFFLEILLIEDFFYLSTILEVISTLDKNNGITYDTLNSLWKNKLISKLTNLIEEADSNKLEKEIRKLKEIRRRIIEWNEAIVYGEHLIMPRLNWLIDLQLMDYKSKLYSLTNQGKELFKHYCYWTDINQGFIINPKTFLNKFYVRVFCNVFTDKSRSLASDNNVLVKKTEEYLEETFLYFKTLAPNRVTLSQALLYTKYKLYLIDNFPIDGIDIEYYIKNIAHDKYIYKFQQQYGDGYLQKK